MRQLLVFSGEAVNVQSLRALIELAREEGFELLGARDYEAGELLEAFIDVAELVREHPHGVDPAGETASPYSYITEWSHYLGIIDPKPEDDVVREVSNALRDMEIVTFRGFTGRPAIIVWRSLRARGVAGIFPALAETMKSLGLHFSDWDLVPEGPVSDMELPVRAKNALRGCGVTDAAILKHLTNDELLDIRNLGVGTIDLVRQQFPAP